MSTVSGQLEHLTPVDRHHGLPDQDVDRIADKSHTAIAHQHVNSPWMSTAGGCRVGDWRAETRGTGKIQVRPVHTSPTPIVTPADQHIWSGAVGSGFREEQTPSSLGRHKESPRIRRCRIETS